MLHGVDISSYQGTINFQDLKTSGISFVYAKATEGLSFVDDHYLAYHDGCKAIRMAFGAYHFLRFNVDLVAQARHFGTFINGRMGVLAPMIDIEEADGQIDLPAKLSQFLTALQQYTKLQPILYTSYSFWNDQMKGYDGFAGHRLWLAEYNKDAEPTLPNGWKHWTLWQHSSTGSVPGIKGNVDMDRLNGDDLRSLT